MNPPVRGLGGACVFRLAAEQKDNYFWVLDVLPPRLPKFKTVQLPRDLVREYIARPSNEPPTYYDGTLFLCVLSCSVTDDGYITEG